jgi:hypothetical protein
MKKEYDFSEGERGKFYDKDAQFQIPIYLDSELQSFVEALAHRKGTDASTVVAELLKRDREIAEYVE